MMVESISGLASARDDFRQARLRAKLEKVIALLSGKSSELLRYQEVRKKLRATNEVERGLRDIPLDAIVGSVDRYADFTRRFLPKHDAQVERWARVKRAMTDLAGLPPIEVYQIGDAYFVLDGNHRVSVARELGAEHIQAYVTEVETRVPLPADVQPGDLILKAEQAAFLERTGVDRLLPGVDLRVSVPGRYAELEEHISVHRYLMGIDQESEVSYAKAVVDWYHTVYLPVVRVAREQGVLRHFPGRTEADLYLWIAEHRAELAQELDWDVGPEAAASDLINGSSPALDRVFVRMGEKLADTVVPEVIVPGPPAGAWRREHASGTDSVEGTKGLGNALFGSILVAVDGTEDGWRALDQAVRVARREGAKLFGLHVTSPRSEKWGDAMQDLKAEFARRCGAAGIEGDLAVDKGDIAAKICERSRWADLAVVSLAHPPGDQPFDRLSSGFRFMIQHCPAPILAVPRLATDMDRILLAYDGSSKADEALYVCAYMAKKWQASLAVVTVAEGRRVRPKALDRARAYLKEHGIQAELVQERGSVAAAVVDTARARGANLIAMGGYGLSPPLEIVLGSTVDQVLRTSEQPVLVCR
jgi:nucleotide-binding universal stress UspA family protein